jgi:hypothetical protein
MDPAINDLQRNGQSHARVASVARCRHLPVAGQIGCLDRGVDRLELVREDRSDCGIDAYAPVVRNGSPDPRERPTQFIDLERRKLPVLGLTRLVKLHVTFLDQHGDQIVHRRLKVMTRPGRPEALPSANVAIETGRISSTPHSRASLSQSVVHLVSGQ